MSNIFAQLLQPPPPTGKPKDERDDGLLFRSSKSGPELQSDYYTRAREADEAAMLARAQASGAEPAGAKSFWESGLGGWLKTNPAIAYGESVKAQLLAPQDMGEGQPPKQPGLGERVMAGLVTVGQVSEQTYNTYIPGTRITGAQAVSKGVEMRPMSQRVQTGAWLSFFGNPWGERMAEEAETQLQTSGADFTLASAMSDPAYWGMTPEQADEFAMAPRGYVGWELPWFDNQMLPNPDAGKPLSQSELMRYQAEWVLNRDRDVATIAGEAEFLLGVAQSDIDFSQAPVVQQLLRQLDVPAPQQQQLQYQAMQATIPHIGMAGPTINSAPSPLSITGTYGAGSTTALTSPTAPNSMDSLGLGPALQFDQRTTEALIRAGYTREILATFADPQEYAKLYGTPDFFTLLAATRTVDAMERMMPLSAVQDQSIPLINQMGFDIAMGTDTVLGLLGDTIGFGGRAARMGVQLNILQDATTPTAAQRAIRIGRGLTGEALTGPMTKEETAVSSQ